MTKVDFSKKIYLGITGETDYDWQSKIEEIKQLKITSVAVFLERFNENQIKAIYKALLKSPIEKVPLVHIRENTTKDEIRFFIKHFKTQYFNIHEEHFDILNKWKGYWDKLYLELNYDNEVKDNVKVEKIGGFCIDLAHFKSSLVQQGKEINYVFAKKDRIKFTCNHLSGCSPVGNRDLHFVNSEQDFDYLFTLPKYIFGNTIAMEIDNPIKEQIKFRSHIVKLLNKYFS